MTNENDNVIKLREYPAMPVATAWVERAGVWGAEQIAGLLDRAIQAERRNLELSAELERRTALLDRALELLDEQRTASVHALAFADEVRASTLPATADKTHDKRKREAEARGEGVRPAWEEP